MAASDVSSKLSNLNLGKDNNETERPKHFCNRALVAMKFSFEPIWLDAAWKAKQKPNLGAVLEEQMLSQTGDHWAHYQHLFEGDWTSILGKAWPIEVYWSNASNKGIYTVQYLSPHLYDMCWIWG